MWSLTCPSPREQKKDPAEQEQLHLLWRSVQARVYVRGLILTESKYSERK